MSEMQKNVIGEELEECSKDPLTGWFRDGCCNTDENDVGLHTVCLKVNDEFLIIQDQKIHIDILIGELSKNLPQIIDGNTRWVQVRKGKEKKSIVYLYLITSMGKDDFHESGIDGHYGFHIDIGPGRVPSMRKIAYSVILNDDFDGGKLNIKLGRQDHYPPQKKGGIIMFPSYMLHCVEPVSKGTRCAVVGWIHGPSFL